MGGCPEGTQNVKILTVYVDEDIGVRVKRIELNMGSPLGTKRANILVVKHSAGEIVVRLLAELNQGR